LKGASQLSWASCIEDGEKRRPEHLFDE